MDDKHVINCNDVPEIDHDTTKMADWNIRQVCIHIR